MNHYRKIKCSDQVSEKNNSSINNLKLNDTLIDLTKSKGDYLYTPTQYLISKYLTTKNTIEDDLINTLKQISEMRSNKETLNCIKLKQQLSKKKYELQGMKRKLTESLQQQTQIYDVMRKRINCHERQTFVKHNNHKKGIQNHSFSKVSLIEAQHEIKDLNNKNGQSKIPTQKVTLNSAKVQSLQNNQFFDKNFNQRMFELNLNKEIAFFMLNQSLKRQKVIKQNEKIQKQKQKTKKEQPVKEQFLEEATNKKSSSHNYFSVLANEQLEDSWINLSQLFDPIGEQPEIQMLMPSTPQIQSAFPQNIISLFLNNKSINKSALDVGNSDKKKQIKLEVFNESQLFDESKFIKITDQEGQMQIQTENSSKNGELSSFKVILNQIKAQIEIECMLFRKKQRIAEDILSNTLQSVNQFFYENSHMIKKYESDLQFWITLCTAINLLKQKDIQKQMNAIKIIRNKVNKMKNIKDWHKSQLMKITQFLFLEPKEIMIEHYLDKTEKQFRRIFQQIYRLSDCDKFLHTIYTGALVLKTPSCIQKSKQNPLICPLCNPKAQKTFNHLPLLTKNQSNLICRINGSIMDHQNYPIMLPSTQIYSFKGLEQNKKITKISGIIVEEYLCKITRTWYNKDQAKKVFLA